MADERIRVLFLDHQAEMGGGEFSMLELLKNLERDEFELVVCLGCDGPFKLKLEEMEVNVEVIRLPQYLRTLKRDPKRKNSLSSIVRSAIATPFAIKQTVKAIKALKADVVCINTVKSACLGVPAARIVGVKSLWIVRDMLTKDFYKGYNLAAIKTLTRNVDHVVCVSEYVKRQYLRLFRSPKGGVSVIYNGVDLEQFNPDVSVGEVRRELAIEGKRVVSLVGRLEPWKGQDVFIRAAGMVSSELDDVVFLIAGGALFGRGDYERECKELAAELGLEDRVKFLGFRKDVPAIIAASDIVVHTSTLPEPFGRDIIEAMACGKPVVSTDAGGPREIVTDDTGVLIEAGSADVLAGEITKLLSDEDGMTLLGANARKRVEDVFDIRKTTRKYQETLKMMTQKG